MPISIAHADEAAAGAFAEFLEGLLVEELRVRVQPRDHARDGVVDELLLVDRLDVVIFTMPNTAASCCSSSSGSCETELLRAIAWNCMVVSAPATAPRANQPATLSFVPIDHPFRPASVLRRHACRFSI